MICVGISGLSNAMRFAQAEFPNRDKREYLMTQGHDSAAAIVKDGEILAAVAEERLSGEKHTGAFPVRAINYCLREAGVDILQVDKLAHSFDYRPYRWLYSKAPYTRELYRRVLSHGALSSNVLRDLPDFPADRIVSVDHHLSHAASVYLLSGWSDSLVLVIDGMGEISCASAYVGEGGSLRRIGRMSAANSIGILYSLVTHHLGFAFNADEYKVMGLAPYGDPKSYAKFFRDEVRLTERGVDIPLLKLNRTAEEKAFFLASRDYIARHLGAARHPNEPVNDSHRDIAAALQLCLEEVILRIASYYQKVTGKRRLSFAGGVAMNCTANGVLRRSKLFDQIFVGPASGDDGSALGAALISVPFEPPRPRIRRAYLGPAATKRDIDEAIAAFEDCVQAEVLSGPAEICENAATLLANGKVLAWFRGRMEFGARALGNRSILADPRIETMRDRVNDMVKKRERFRPFAPAVILEEATRWFEIEPNEELPFMTAVVHGVSTNLRELPAVTHVDGSARIQTVSRTDNPIFYMLLETFRRKTGFGVLLNTSFNVQGQPIVATAYKAVGTFLSTSLDVLFLEDRMITRRRP